MQPTEFKVKKVSLNEQLYTGGESAFARYRQKTTGDVSLSSLLFYEFYTLFFARLGGAIGYLLRKWSARLLFRSTGSGLILGLGLVIRHPARITIENNVAIDDYVFLDASGNDNDGIKIGDGVIISRNCVIQGKTGSVVLQERVDIGCNCVLSSVSGITIGASTLIAGNCYIGGGRYFHEKLDLPIMDQGGYSRGPIIIGENSWIGAGATILDGVTVGKGAIIGAGSVVSKNVPDYAVVAGIPAKVLRLRGEKDQ